MNFLRLSLISVLGFLLYNERVEWFLFAGSTLIIAGNLVNVRAEHRLAPVEKLPDIGLRL